MGACVFDILWKQEYYWNIVLIYVTIVYTTEKYYTTLHLLFGLCDFIDTLYRDTFQQEWLTAYRRKDYISFNLLAT